MLLDWRIGIAPLSSARQIRDAAAALVGSLGLVPSVNAGDTFVMGEPYVSNFVLPNRIDPSHVRSLTRCPPLLPHLAIMIRVIPLPFFTGLDGPCRSLHHGNFQSYQLSHDTLLYRHFVLILWCLITMHLSATVTGTHWSPNEMKTQ